MQNIREDFGSTVVVNVYGFSSASKKSNHTITEDFCQLNIPMFYSHISEHSSLFIPVNIDPIPSHNVYEIIANAIDISTSSTRWKLSSAACKRDSYRDWLSYITLNSQIPICNLEISLDSIKSKSLLFDSFNTSLFHSVNPFTHSLASYQLNPLNKSLMQRPYTNAL